LSVFNQFPASIGIGSAKADNRAQGIFGIPAEKRDLDESLVRLFVTLQDNPRLTDNIASAICKNG